MACGTKKMAAAKTKKPAKKAATKK